MSYVRAFRAWKKCGAGMLPADPGAFALYLVHLIQKGSSVSLLNTALYGTSWVHKKSGLQELGDHPLVRHVVEAGRRILARPPNGKNALEVSQIRRIIQRPEQSHLADLQVVALFVLRFFGFLCWDDLRRLTVPNLHFAKSHLAVFLKQRNNDQFRDSSWVFIARSDSFPCPVAVVEKFLGAGRHDKKSRLFCQILSTKRKMELRKEPLSYSQANELIKLELQKEGLDPKLYGIHSLRMGGASAAAASGVPDRLGGWHSVSSRNTSIHESL